MRGKNCIKIIRLLDRFWAVSAFYPHAPQPDRSAGRGIPIASRSPSGLEFARIFENGGSFSRRFSDKTFKNARPEIPARNLRILFLYIIRYHKWCFEF
jgi:hypothetical protein